MRKLQLQAFCIHVRSCICAGGINCILSVNNCLSELLCLSSSNKSNFVQIIELFSQYDSTLKVYSTRSRNKIPLKWPQVVTVCALAIFVLKKSRNKSRRHSSCLIGPLRWEKIRTCSLVCKDVCKSICTDTHSSSVCVRLATVEHTRVTSNSNHMKYPLQEWPKPGSCTPL